ncbi:hypothetical protein GYMLUDRAFT_251255 [Collybiopsis luxurians FD-317 M1]|uniref:F-box domain-containing protein n=1 Tax=Collybiopsis luxurians FD-317 M1 TaxID=944289 RepID=A0A0D0C3P4_9AGAR|nr:hypothetical protein GYMLUDRAFT_251255 [Collybiopsis luxurians FD-317 M1]
MRLFEDAEYRCRMRVVGRLSDETDGSDSLPEYYRVYQVDRFFATIKGFLEGDLDLTGRHQRRLDELMPLWTTFAEDFNAIKRISTTSLVMTMDWIRRTHRETTVYTLSEDAWSDFRNRWKIPWSISFTSLVQQAEVLDLLSHSKPKIQQLCLTDLPSEILDFIMSIASMDKARLLSATCKQLYQIGLPYLFGSRTLSLRYFDYTKLDDADGEAWVKLKIKLALQTRQTFLDKVDFFLSRPDISRQTRQLFFGNEYRIGEEDDMNGIIDLASFYAPVSRAVVKVLDAPVNPQILMISCHDLCSDFFIAVSHLSHLRRLSMINCRFSEILTSSILTLPKCGQIRILNISDFSIDFDERTENSTWTLLPLFPHIRVLNMMRPAGMRNFILHPPPSIQRLNLFLHLRYFALFQFYDLPNLSTWIRLNRLQGPLSLTHFKVLSRWGWPDHEVIDLLEALRAAPLEALSIDGLQDGSLMLIERVAEYFPNLRALSLVRRENDRQVKAESSMWPRASWEYAPLFARFNRLEHFLWNYRVLHDHFVYPTALLLFEKDASGEKWEDEDEDIRWDLQDLISEAEEYGCVDAARLLAAYCPSLKGLCTVRGTGCVIARDGYGRSVFTCSFIIPEWDPTEWEGWNIDVKDAEDKPVRSESDEDEDDEVGV